MIWAVTFNPSRDMTYLIDAPWTPGSIVTAAAVIGRPGGKGNNVARVAKVMGAAVTAVGFYGGRVGTGVCADLADEGISVVAENAQGETRTCLTIVAGDGVVTEIRDPGPLVERGAELRLLETICERIAKEDLVTLSGSLPPGLDANTWTRWIQRLSPLCRGVLVDTSGYNLKAAAMAETMLMLPNRSEWDAASIPLIRPLVITEGAEGVTWYPHGDHSVRHIRPPRVVPKNTVGAGDALLGGLVYALAMHQAWDQALALAVAVATASVTTPGVADLDPDLARELVHQVQID